MLRFGSHRFGSSAQIVQPTSNHLKNIRKMLCVQIRDQMTKVWASRHERTRFLNLWSIFFPEHLSVNLKRPCWSLNISSMPTVSFCDGSNPCSLHRSGSGDWAKRTPSWFKWLHWCTSHREICIQCVFVFWTLLSEGKDKTVICALVDSRCPKHWKVEQWKEAERSLWNQDEV